jgi:hypothetical protein
LFGQTHFLTLPFSRFAAALLAVCLSVSCFAGTDIALLRVSGQRDPVDFNCPAHRARAFAQTPQPGTPAPTQAPPSHLLHQAASPENTYTPGLKVGLWGDSHTASGTFTDSLLEALRLPRLQAYPSFIAPTFGLKGVRYPLRRACLSDDWHLAMAYRTPTEGPETYTKSLSAIRTEQAGAFMWLDFRYPEAQTRVKWADIHFATPPADQDLLLGITVDESPETIVNLGQTSSQRLRIEADKPFATLRLRLVSGQISVDGIAPVYDAKPQTILDVFSIPGATAKGWRVVNTTYLRQQDPLAVGYDVVILQSGTNESLDPDFKVGLYEAQLNASLTRLKTAYPRARCILIGPPDAKRSANTVRLINDSQYRLASAKGCTHWHWQKTMGGPGASVQWLAKGWMQADLLHLTPEGYTQSARSLASMVAIKGR